MINIYRKLSLPGSFGLKAVYAAEQSKPVSSMLVITKTSR